MPQIVCCFVAGLALFESRRTKKKAAIFLLRPSPLSPFSLPLSLFLGFVYFCYIFVTGKKSGRGAATRLGMNCNAILRLAPAAMATNWIWLEKSGLRAGTGAGSYSQRVVRALFWLPTSLPGSRQSDGELLLRPGAKPKRKFGVRNRAADDSENFPLYPYPWHTLALPHHPWPPPSARICFEMPAICMDAAEMADVMNFQGNSLLIFQVTAENSPPEGSTQNAFSTLFRLSY